MLQDEEQADYGRESEIKRTQGEDPVKGKKGDKGDCMESRGKPQGAPYAQIGRHGVESLAPVKFHVLSGIQQIQPRHIGPQGKGKREYFQGKTLRYGNTDPKWTSAWAKSQYHTGPTST